MPLSTTYTSQRRGVRVLWLVLVIGDNSHGNLQKSPPSSNVSQVVPTIRASRDLAFMYCITSFWVYLDSDTIVFYDLGVIQVQISHVTHS